MYAAVDGFALPYDARYASHNPYASTYITGLVLAAVDGDFIMKMEWIRLIVLLSSVGPHGDAAPVSVAAA